MPKPSAAPSSINGISLSKSGPEWVPVRAMQTRGMGVVISVLMIDGKQELIRPKLIDGKSKEYYLYFKELR
jgi:hypothetical protein